MLYYDIRDIGLAEEVKCFMYSFQPRSEANKPLTSMSNNGVDCDLQMTFPHSLVMITGHAGTGKTHFLKYFVNEKGIMFYAPTNASGINLQNVLCPQMLFQSQKKNIYRTIHSFYGINPAESTILGQSVERVRGHQETYSTYDEYLCVMQKGSEPFCKMLFDKEIEAKHLSPDEYQAYVQDYVAQNSVESDASLHERVIDHIIDVGKGSKIPLILRYNTCVLEEAGRTPDYLAFLFLFYYYYMHVKYNTQAWKHVTPSLVFSGSPTQCNFIKDHTPFSAMTFISLACVRRYANKSGRLMLKAFEDNRRITAGNIETNTVLSSVISKLEIGMSIKKSLGDKFHATFSVAEETFFDPEFRSNHFRIAKHHKDLKSYKANVFKRNRHNIVTIPEFFLTDIDVPFLCNIQSKLNVKMKSETYEEQWRNMNKRQELFDREYNVYETERTCLRGFSYLLTEQHSLYLKHFAGTIKQLITLMDILQPYIMDDRSSCAGFFVKCAKHIIEDVYSDDADTVVKSIHDFLQTSSDDEIQQIISLKTMLSQCVQNKSMRDKVFAHVNETPGTRIWLPKDIFSFTLVDVEIGKKSGVERASFHVQFHECLTMKMYTKKKSVSTSEIMESTTMKRKWRPTICHEEDMFDDDERDCEDLSDDLPSPDHGGEMQDMFLALQNKSIFVCMPMVLHICSTIDATQGLTINGPIIALLKRGVRAEDIIVALTRSSNPDLLMVASRVFDNKYESISPEIVDVIKLIHQSQRTVGWL